MRHTLDEVLSTFPETNMGSHQWLKIYTVRESIDCDGYMSNSLALLFSGCNADQIRGDVHYPMYKDWILESVNWDDPLLKCSIMVGRP